MLSGNRIKLSEEGSKIELASDYNPSESFGLYEVVTFVLTFASGVGASIVASWICGKASDEHAKIVYRGHSIPFEDLVSIFEQMEQLDASINKKKDN